MQLSMGDILARVRGGSTPAPPPAPKPVPRSTTPRPARSPSGTTHAPQAIRRVARNQGYDLVVGSERAVGVQPSGAGWVVHNVGASHKTTLDDARAADAMAARIARLMAAP